MNYCAIDLWPLADFSVIDLFYDGCPFRFVNTFGLTIDIDIDTDKHHTSNRNYYFQLGWSIASSVYILKLAIDERQTNIQMV